MKTSEKIIEYIKKNRQATGKELSDYLEISDRAVRKQLSKLVEEDLLSKIGKPPKVYYFLKKIKEKEEVLIDEEKRKIIEENYLIITSSGEKIDGLNGFIYWCKRNNLDINKTADEYIKTIRKYDGFKVNGIINGMDKFKKTFDFVFLDNIYYLDFYSIERFGKTKLGQLLLYGKQSGNKKIIKEIITEIKPKIEKIIKDNKIDAIGFIPWTVKREVQFMRELEKGLNLPIKKILIEKVKTEIIVPQKSLSKTLDRIENARNTILVIDKGNYNNILLIDDAVGSGATLNETARQIKERDLAKNVMGLSITGSFKGFDVISEV
jgi:phosphoribosylpyrophosphate synthetase